MSISPTIPPRFLILPLLFLWGLVPAVFTANVLTAAQPVRPNILWLIVEDISPHLGCYGEDTIATPRLDRLAAEGTRFDLAFTTGSICSPARSALITGRYQTSIGAQNHRSSEGTEKIHLPAGVDLVPALFQRAGYYTSNGDWPLVAKKAVKADYNFEWDHAVYDGQDWSGRSPGQPFFAQLQLFGGKYRDLSWWREAKGLELLPDRTPPETVTLPPYYPATPELRQDWADTLDAIRATDLQVGEILDRLEEEGVLDQTVIFFISDHGVSHARGKQFLYDEGTRIPFIAAGPGVPRGAVRNDLVEQIDLAATSLALAGVTSSQNPDSRDLFAADHTPRTTTIAARDRADETIDCIRSVRTKRWKYIRNYYPLRPALAPNAYKDNKPSIIALRAEHAAGRLNATQELLFAPTRPPEELYDLAVDPWEIHNLAAEPRYAKTLKKLSHRLTAWMRRTGDPGPNSETEKQYDSEMAAYLHRVDRIPGRRAEVEGNIAVMKQWAREGK